MSNLVELFDNVVEFQNYNGVPLAAGKLYVFALGRTRLMDTWSDIDGESLNPNPIILDDIGQCHCYVSDAFDYTLVVCDQYNNEIFSLDKYLYSKGEHSHADVAVAPSEHIGVSSYHVGEVTVYVPYLTGEVGKVYEGILPIVVNNDVNRISANHIPLGVQDPLYFVEDSETACILGCSAQTEIPAEISGKWDEASDVVIANSAQWAEGTEYEAGSYVDIDNNTISITGLQPEGDYAYNSALSSKLDVTALPQDLVHSGDLTAYQPAGDYQTAGNYLSASELENLQPKGDYYSASNPSGFINSDAISAMATTGLVADVSADITALIPTDLFTKESADTLYQPIGNYQTAGNYVSASELTAYATTSLVSSVSSTITGMITTGDFELVAGTNIELVDDAVNHTTTINMTADIPSTAGLATTAQLADVSADVTALIPTDLFTKASADTLYQPIGNYLSSNALEGYATEDWVTGQGYITNDAITGKQDITGMTAYQVAGDYLTTADSAEFMTTAERSDYIPTGVSSEFYTTANTANYISEVPAGTMNESAFSYDASDNITAYNGSAFKAGDEFPQSATEAIETVTANSADWNDTTDTVTANSGAWGGSALPISAGPGIALNLVNGVLVISTAGE